MANADLAALLLLIVVLLLGLSALSYVVAAFMHRRAPPAKLTDLEKGYLDDELESAFTDRPTTTTRSWFSAVSSPPSTPSTPTFTITFFAAAGEVGTAGVQPPMTMSLHPSEGGNGYCRPLTR